MSFYEGEKLELITAVMPLTLDQIQIGSLDTS